MRAVVGFECQQGQIFLEKPLLIDKRMESQSNGGLFSESWSCALQDFKFSGRAYFGFVGWCAWACTA